MWVNLLIDEIYFLSMKMGIRLETFLRPARIQKIHPAS